MPVTKVHISRLLDDQLDLYPYSAEEAVLVELVANALDAHPDDISITLVNSGSIFAISDNGRGMNDKEFRDYHDIASSPKSKGDGIGFAGLGAKLALKVSDKVVTETKRGALHLASQWRLNKIKDEAPWDYIKSKTLTEPTGTKVTLHLKDSRSNLLKPEWVETVLRANFGPLLETNFASTYGMGEIYPKNIRFSINGLALHPNPLLDESKVASAKEQVLRLGKRRGNLAVARFILAKEALPQESQGITLATYGKSVKKELLSQYPSEPNRITGIIESPRLAKHLTLSKTDFKKDQGFYRTYRQLQKAFKEWLASVGQLKAEPRREQAPREAAALQTLVSQIIASVPELQRVFVISVPKPVAVPDPGGDRRFSLGELFQKVKGTLGGKGKGKGVPVSPGEDEGLALDSRNGTEPGTTVNRPVRIGPKVTYQFLSEEPKVGWVDGDTLIINSGHPAFVKAENSGARYYHDLFSAAVALAEQAGVTEPSQSLDLLHRFFHSWGRL